MSRPRREGGRLAVTFVAAAVGLLTVGVGQAAAQEGDLEVCKSPLNGMAAREFPFTVEDGVGNVITGFTLAGGECTPPMTIPAGNYTVAEGEALDATRTSVAAISTTFGTLVARSLANRQITVRVREGPETLVRFTNRAVPAQVKICKETNTPAFDGTVFTFRYRNQAGQQLGSAVAIAANGDCSGLRSFRAGSIVSVNEEVPPSAVVVSIRVEGQCTVIGSPPFRTNERGVEARLASGVCVVTFVNTATPVRGTGFIEICKDVTRPDLVGESFFFRVSPPPVGQQQPIEVRAGHCSPPMRVPAGRVTVTEEPDPRFRVVHVSTEPEGSLVGANLINRQAVVDVVATENPEQETQVRFLNERERGQLKICKALGPFSRDLIGIEFQFVVIDPRDPDDPTDDQVVGHPRTIRAAATTQCIIVGQFPVGVEFIVDELPYDDPTTPGIDEGEFIVTIGCPRAITIRPGVNTVTCVNE